MIPLGAIVRDRQPEVYAALGERYHLPMLPTWTGGVTVGQMDVGKDFTRFQRMMRHTIKGGMYIAEHARSLIATACRLYKARGDKELTMEHGQVGKAGDMEREQRGSFDMA